MECPLMAQSGPGLRAEYHRISSDFRSTVAYENMPGYFDLSERVVLVTGASRGLGLAMAEALAEAGATVILNGRDANTLKIAADRICESGGQPSIDEYREEVFSHYRR
jgi:NADPH:quinone reductase-like Zn-dependent oxidoreductase